MEVKDRALRLEEEQKKKKEEEKKKQEEEDAQELEQKKRRASTDRYSVLQYNWGILQIFNFANFVNH